jgi:hypothetical protein
MALGMLGEDRRIEVVFYLLFSMDVCRKLHHQFLLLVSTKVEEIREVLKQLII